MKCFVQKVIVAGTEAGQPNNHCHQNRGEKSWLLTEMQGKCWSQRESRLDSCWRWRSWSCCVWGWKNLEVQSADVVLFHEEQTLFIYHVEHLIQPSCILQKKINNKTNPRTTKTSQTTPKTKQPENKRESNTLFLQAVKSQPFYKTQILHFLPDWATVTLDNKLCRFAFGDCFFPLFSTSVVSFRESWLKWQHFEEGMWLWVFPLSGELFVTTQSSAGLVQSCCSLCSWVWRKWIMELSSLFCVKHF